MSEGKLAGPLGQELWGSASGTVRMWVCAALLDLMARAGLMAVVTGKLPPEWHRVKEEVSLWC